MSELKAETPAAQIAEIMYKVTPEDRGLILQQAAAYLRIDAQAFTASVFDKAAEIYNAG